jgi:cytochrome c-type biogenesis protein CcmH
MAVGLYLYNSDWRLALVGNSPEAVPLLLQRLERHLEQEPGDAAGWRLLAQTLVQLRRFDDGARAYARLNALDASAESLVGEAEALALATGGSLQGRPEELIEQALRVDPGFGRAQWYAGMAARQRNDNARALAHWKRLAGQELPQDFRQLLERQILQAGGTPPQAPQRFQIAVQVSLDPKLMAQVSPDMPVFLYARVPGQGGPPLAVMRKRVSELPLSVALDDSLSMLPERKLSSVDYWTITARIARQGSAEGRSGDLFAEATLRREELPAPVKLVINRQLP